jgi:hypothetical protein
MACHLLLERHADMLLADRWGHTPEQFHRLRADRPSGPIFGGGLAAPKRDGRGVILADMIRDRQVRATLSPDRAYGFAGMIRCR